MATIKVVVREPGRAAVAREVELSAKALQGIVLGYIELVLQVRNVFDDDSSLMIFANEDGRAFRASPSVILRPDRDPIYGPIIAVKTGADGKETTLEGDDLARVLNLVGAYPAAPPSDN